MERRGEFGNEFNDEAEHIIDGLTFDADEPINSMNSKIQALQCYNSQLQVRKLKTKVVLEWQLHYGKPRDWQNTMGGQTPAERDIDARLLTLAPYIGRKKTEGIAAKIHELSRTTETIAARQRWQKNGIQSISEGVLFSMLETLVRDGKVSEVEVHKWNRAIAEYESEARTAEPEDAKLLTQKELELCQVDDIRPPMFVALKDLIIREYAVRGSLSLEEALELVPEEAEKVGHMYELFAEAGWIAD
jgi:transcriptional adapter 2-alpha